MGVRHRAVAAAAAACAIGIGSLAAPVATAAPVLAGPALLPAAPVPAATGPGPGPGGWAPAADAPIRPGVVVETDGGGVCTADFVVTGGGRVFLGQAAHCAGTGPPTEVDGCSSATGPVGTAVTIRAADGTDRAATLAYSSWVAMQAGGETDPDTCAHNDFALVEIAAADVADVNPSVPFFGGPTGIDTDGLGVGEEVFTVGGSPRHDGTRTVRPKVGIGAGDVGGGRGHEVHTVVDGVPGDSGSPFLDAGGRAVGLLSTLTLEPSPVVNGVTDLARALRYAGINGGLGELELVVGTEPFTPTPPGVPLTEIAPPAGPPVGDG